MENFIFCAVTLITWYNFVGTIFFKVNNQDTRARFLAVDIRLFYGGLKNEVNLFVPNTPIFYPLKASESCKVF